MTVPVLVVSGTIGAGKTSVVDEAIEVLREAKISHVAIDLDWLGQMWPPQSRFNEDVTYENLRCAWENFSRHGAERLVVAHVVESPGDRSRYVHAIDDAEVTVCLVTAPPEARRARIEARELGSMREWHLFRTVELDEILERAGVEDFRVSNDGDRPIRAVAYETLTKAGWLGG